MNILKQRIIECIINKQSGHFGGVSVEYVDSVDTLLHVRLESIKVHLYGVHVISHIYTQLNGNAGIIATSCKTVFCWQVEEKDLGQLQNLFNIFHIKD